MKKAVMVFVLFFFNMYGFGQSIGNQPNGQNNNSNNNYTRPEANDRFKKYIKGTFGPRSLINPIASATFKQFRNSPREWERNSGGFGKRFGDSFARQFISNSITYGLDEALKLDSHFYKSPKRDFKSKFSNAVISAVTARNKEGKRVLGVPKLVGSYSAAIIANETWMPNRFNYKNGLRDGTISIGTRIGFNLLREFILK
jgi:hypothetical protein